MCTPLDGRSVGFHAGLPTTILNGLGSTSRFVGFCLGPPGAPVFLKLPRLHNEAVGYSDELVFSDRLARCGGVVDALVEPCVEVLQ